MKTPKELRIRESSILSCLVELDIIMRDNLSADDVLFTRTVIRKLRERAEDYRKQYNALNPDRHPIPEAF